MKNLNRRNFIQKGATAAACLMGANSFAFSEPLPMSPPDQYFVIGPMEGYTPHIGALVSMLNYNRFTIINAVKALTQQQLDHLHDPQANTIGALVMHLGAVDKFYQINTFEGRQEFTEEEDKVWGAAMELGDRGRKEIKGHNADYYLSMIDEVRQKTLAELKKKDDNWLLAIDPAWSEKRPLNTYWKWFHVCEHESNHRGQITWQKGRLPGMKAGKD